MNITLFADRLGRQAPTGIGLYIARTLEYVPTAAPDISFTARAWREKAAPAVTPGPNLSYAYVPGSRRLNQVIGSMAGLPASDWIDPATDLVHVLLPIPISTKRPLVVTVHDLSPILYPAHYSVASRLVFRAGMRRAVRQARHLIAVSHDTAAALRALYPVPAHRISVVHHGVDIPEVRLSQADRAALRQRYGIIDRFILFSGSITHRKNLAVLVKAFARIAGDFPSLQLVLAGNNGLGADRVRAAVSDTGLGARICLPGYLPREDLLALMAMADVFAFPSIHEGFGWPPLEAMAQGTPVVAAAGGAVPEIVGDAALLAQPNDIEGMAANLRSALESDKRAQHLRQAGRARARSFSWDKMAREMIAIYQRVLAEPPYAGRVL